MNYSKVDYEFLASSTPVNGTAASVISKPTEYDSGAEAKEEYRNLGKAIDRISRNLGKMQYDSEEKKFALKRRQDCIDRRVELAKQFPMLAAKKRNASDYILDECKKRMSEADFNACVRVGLRLMEEEVAGGRDIGGNQ